MTNETKFQINAMHAALSELAEDIARIRETTTTTKTNQDKQLDMMWSYIEHMLDKQTKLQNCMLSMSQTMVEITENMKNAVG